MQPSMSLSATAPQPGRRPRWMVKLSASAEPKDVNCSLAIIFLMRTTCTYFETNLPFQYTFQQKNVQLYIHSCQIKSEQSFSDGFIALYLASLL